MSETEQALGKASDRRPSGDEPVERLAEWNREMFEEFRASNGRVGGMFATLDLALLTTTGAKSGKRRTTPMAYYTDGDRLIMLASNFGRRNHPAWYYNILRTPDVTLEVAADSGTETFQARAVVIEGEERDRLFDWVASIVPGYADYQKNITRIIPVVALERVR